jgi:hypothetical protein
MQNISYLECGIHSYNIMQSGRQLLVFRGSYYSKNKSSMFLQNICNYLPDYSVLFPKSQPSTSSMPQ